MYYKIHFKYPDGTDEYFVVIGSLDKEIQEEVQLQLRRRGIFDHSDCWSEEVKG
jgi:hypothetical protein